MGPNLIYLVSNKEGISGRSCGDKEKKPNTQKPWSWISSPVLSTKSMYVSLTLSMYNLKIILCFSSVPGF